MPRHDLHIRRLPALLLLGLLLAIAIPAGASAATVVRQADGTLVYTGSGSAKNHVGVQGSDDDSTITFYTSGGDEMNAPAGCAPSDLYGGEVVTCSMPTAVRVELGAGDDDANVSDGIPVPVTLGGGPGADWLNASAEGSVLDGGPGEDKLVGGAGDDVLRGGDDNDTIEGKDGSDRIDAGAGDDLISPDGYEHANADVVDGGPGRDTISGDLAGGDCGPLWCKYPYGNDTIEARDGEVDSITCGAGTDTVNADPQDVVAPDCENVRRGSAAGAAPGTKAGGATLALRGRTRLAKALRSGFTVRVSGVHAGRRVKLTARRGGKVMARGSATARSTVVTVRLRFTTAARKALKRKRKATLVVSGGAVRGTVTLRR